MRPVPVRGDLDSTVGVHGSPRMHTGKNAPNLHDHRYRVVGVCVRRPVLPLAGDYLGVN